MWKSAFLLFFATLIYELDGSISIDQALHFQPISKDGKSWVINGNKLVDIILQYIKPQIPDSFPLKDIQGSYHKKVWFVKFGGTYHLWDGKVWGFNTVRRTGDTAITYHDETKLLEITSSFGAPQLWGSYTGRGKMKPITITPGIRANIRDLVVSVKICATVLKSMQIHECGVKINVGSVKLSFSGLHMFNGLASRFSNQLLNRRKPKLIQKAEKSLRKILRKYFEKHGRKLGYQIQNIIRHAAN